MIEGFIHPGLALGALLAAVPLLIHLLNRQRHKPLEWGAMRFVQAAYKRTRRRSQIENLLLLLMRMGAVALLAFLLARPFTEGAGPLSALTENRRNLVLIVDTSASTGYQEQGGNVFERSIERARALVSDLDAARGDRAQIVLGDDNPRLLAWREPKEALSLLATLDRPSDGRFDLPRSLSVAREAITDEALTEGGAEVDLRLLTDCQANVFESGLAQAEADAPIPDASTADDGVAEDSRRTGRSVLQLELDALAELGVELRVEDLGPELVTPDNLGVAAIQEIGDPASVGLPSEIAVRIQNHGERAAADVRVTLSIDGNARPVRTLDVPARGNAEALFTVSFDAPGPHLVEATLEGDRLAIDDSRARVLMAPAPIRVLGVNGAPDREDLTADELGLISTVLMPPDGDAFGLLDISPFEYDEVDPAELGRSDLELNAYDVILIANVAALEVQIVDALSAAVREGAALIVTLGDRTSPELLNARLWRSDGSGLLPAELIERIAVPSRRDGYWRVADFDTEHPALTFFSDERWRPFLTEVPVFEYIVAKPLSDARVLARLDQAGDPLLIERAFGRGKLFLWTTSIDSAWTRLPELPKTLVPLTHELLRYAGTRPTPPHTVDLGAALTAELPRFPREPILLRPDGERRTVESQPRALISDRWALELVENVGRVGAYLLEVEEGQPIPFAAQFDAVEGDLHRIGPTELRALHPGLVPLEAAGSAGASDDPESDRRGELWRSLAWLCLGLLIAESLFSAFIGNRRSVKRGSDGAANPLGLLRGAASKLAGRNSDQGARSQ